MLTNLILEIKSDQTADYTAFFMDGLLQNENKFRISPDDERRSAFPTNYKPDSFTLGACVDDQLVGVVSFEREGATREKLRHKGLLFRMYVNSAFAGKGVGRQLIAELIDRVRALKNVEQINLTVIADNEKAIKLYTSFGFETFSIEERAIKWKGNYLTEQQMVLHLY
jgi:cyclohexyl-isocyanide hydratase